MTITTVSMEAIFRLSPIIPVVTIERLEDAIPLAEALKAGGCRVIEIALRTPVALEALQSIHQSVDGITVGVGTILEPGQLNRAIGYGAEFAVSPGNTDKLLNAGLNAGIPYLPGVATVSEIMHAMDYGFTHFKLFPAVALNGQALLKSISALIAQACFCPTGGINPQNLNAYLHQPNVNCVGGSWMCSSDDIHQRDWKAITDKTRQALAQARELT